VVLAFGKNRALMSKTLRPGRNGVTNYFRLPAAESFSNFMPEKGETAQ